MSHGIPFRFQWPSQPEGSWSQGPQKNSVARHCCAPQAPCPCPEGPLRQVRGFVMRYGIVLNPKPDADANSKRETNASKTLCSLPAFAAAPVSPTERYFRPKAMVRASILPLWGALALAQSSQEDASGAPSRSASASGSHMGFSPAGAAGSFLFDIGQNGTHQKGGAKPSEAHQLPSAWFGLVVWRLVAGSLPYHVPPKQTTHTSFLKNKQTKTRTHTHRHLVLARTV